MSLAKIFNARTVAVIGASRDETKRGFQAIQTLLEGKFEGKIYPVNPKEESILGLPCYKDVLNIEDEVDLALITTPAKTVPKILEDCGQKGIKGAVIVAGGFREVGKEGKSLEDHTLNIARKYNIRYIGPNTSGMINVHSKLNLVGLHDTPKGDIALISQSGNMALSLICEAHLRSLKGFSYYIGVGNESDIKYHEYLEFLRDDPKTKLILMYVEGIRDGRRFLQQAHATTLIKPIVLLKGGRSEVGKRSAGSHTGALAGISEVSRTAFKRAGIIVLENTDELFPAAESLSSLPPLKNNCIAILADGGGHATMAADILTDLGVEIPKLSEKIQNRLRKILPTSSAYDNPVDVAGATDSDPTIFADCAETILKDPHIGGLLIVGLFGGYGIRFAESLKFKEEDAAHRLGKIKEKRHKPIIVHSLYEWEKPHSLYLLRYYGIPVYSSLDIACKCMGIISEYGKFLKSYHAKASFFLKWGIETRNEGKQIIQKAMLENRNVLTEFEAKRLLRVHGLPVMKDVLAQTEEDAVEAAKKIGSEVALKIVSPDILHKTDIGGVKLNLGTTTGVRRAYQEIIANARKHKPDADIKGVLVSPMAEKGVEVIVGTKVDDQFGPVLLFGMGGILVETIKDISTRVLPITNRSAKRMIEDIKMSPILKGTRGTPPCDLKSLRELLKKVSSLIESYPEIHEMDLNPVIVHENGVTIVDARILLGTPLSNNSNY